MRYTTVIDISEMPEVYKNSTARLIYLHMSLKAGYHDADRDLVKLSIRRLSSDVGVTVSATRPTTLLPTLASANLYSGR